MDRTAKEAFIKRLQALCPSRRKRWDAVFTKYEKEGKLDQPSYSLDELIEEEPDQEVSFSSYVNRDKLSEDDKRIADDIEKLLKSNFKQLLLQREKTKLLLDPEDYEKIHPQLLSEWKRVRETLSQEDLIKYVVW